MAQPQAARGARGGPAAAATALTFSVNSFRTAFVARSTACLAMAGDIVLRVTGSTAGQRSDAVGGSRPARAAGASRGQVTAAAKRPELT